MSRGGSTVEQNFVTAPILQITHLFTTKLHSLFFKHARPVVPGITLPSHAIQHGTGYVLSELFYLLLFLLLLSSCALSQVKARISIQEKRLSVHRMGRERLGSDGRLTPTVRERLSSDGRSTPRSLYRKEQSSLSNTSLNATVSETELSGSESTGSVRMTQPDEEGEWQSWGSPRKNL